MGKCNEELFKLLSQNKIEKTDEIEIRVKRKLNDCRRINAMRPVATSAAATPDSYLKPQNKFECMRKGCVNSGTLKLAAAGDTATYKTTDSTEFANGVVTFYVYPDDVATLPNTVTFKIGDQDTMTDADVYTVTIEEVGADGFAPVVILLDSTPTSVEGNGWTPSATGSYIEVSSATVMGFSSFAFFEALEDFELYDIIKLRCITNAGDDQSLSTLEEACQDVQYDDNVNTIPFSVTANLASSNYMKANPMFSKGNEVVGFKSATVKKTVEAYTVGTDEYGRITLADSNQDECQRIAVQYQDDCEAVLLTPLSVPVLIGVDAGHFLTIANADGSTDLIFDATHVGREFLVSYPKTAEVEKSIYSPDYLNDAEVSLVWTKHLSDGTEIVDVFDNVFVTGFPRNITDTSAAFTWSFNIARATDGNFYYTQKIL